MTVKKSPQLTSAKTACHGFAKQLWLESLESRDLLAGDVSAAIVGEVLEVLGGDESDSVSIRSVELATEVVNDGVTSVDLDFETLATVGITLVGADNTVPSEFPENAGVGFQITPESSLEVRNNGDLQILGGSIEHTGTVTLLVTPSDANFEAAEVTLGDFTIGLRETGFFVASTVGDGEPLVVFDVDVQPLQEDVPLLDGAVLDLSVSPEFAEVLTNGFGLPDLTGTDVGDARIDAITVDDSNEFIKVRGLFGTTVNEGRSETFLASAVSSINVETAGGSDRVWAYGFDVESFSADLGDGWRNSVFASGISTNSTSVFGGVGRDSVTFLGSSLGDTTVILGEGRDRFRVTSSDLGTFDLQTGAGRDAVDIVFSEIGGNATVDLGEDSDRASVLLSTFRATTVFDGGGGRSDSFRSLFSDYSEEDGPTLNDFRRRVLVG